MNLIGKLKSKAILGRLYGGLYSLEGQYLDLIPMDRKNSIKID